MRHHPTGLAIKPDKTELDNVAALDRLAYARNYLRKLIQLDVHLPTLAAAEAMQLLLNPIPQAVAVAKPSLADRWRTSRSLVAGLLVQCGLSLTVVAALGAAAFQVWTTVNVMKAERLQVRERLMQSDLSQLRQAGTDMRLYEKWSLQKADAAKKNAEASKQKTEDALQKANPVQEAVYRANADSTVGLIKTMEQALPTLEQLAREGREEAFRDFQTKAFKPGQTAFAALTQNAVQFDGKTWDTVKQELWTATTAKEAATKNLANGPKDDGNPRQREPSASKPATSPAVKKIALGEPFLILLIVGGLLWASRNAKDNFVVEPTPEYEKALEARMPEMMANKETASPRELKRFMNLSRFVVARLNSTVANEADRVNEVACVNLTATWCLTKATGASFIDAWERALHPGGVSLRDRQLFVAVVGELGLPA